jgi:chloramphenicol-sensitive protein RarD
MIKGVGLSLAASVLFAAMYYYTSLLAPLDGQQIFGWRMLLTVPIMTIFVVSWGEWHQVRELARRLRQEWRLWIVLPVSSLLLGIQLWLFLWAPLHGKALEVSIGYFMLPLSMLLVGRFVYREQLSVWQKLAALSALLGVAHELYRFGGFPWTALVVATGYPCYFVLRRSAATNNLGGLWFDMLLTLPAAYVFAIAGADVTGSFGGHPRLYLLIPVLGLISAVAVACYVLASHHLTLSLFGLLGYVEPVLLVVVALLLGERIGAQEWLTYIPIWLAVGLLSMEGIFGLRRARSTTTASGGRLTASDMKNPSDQPSDGPDGLV